MKFLVILAVLCATAFCKPAGEGVVKVSQDTAGNYNIYYSYPGASRNEISNNGIVSGSYSYIDSNGRLQTVYYSAGPKGFVVHDGPVPAAFAAHSLPVHYTPEVAAARVKQLAVLAAEAARLSA